MTTTINQALKKSGLAVPLNKRIWSWLKDNGEHTGAEIAAALNIPPSASSSIISGMVSRNMLKANKRFSRYAKREIGHFSAVGKDFVILPVQTKHPEVVEVKKPIVVSDPKLVSQTTSTKLTPEYILDELSVNGAYELYLRLDKIFNKKETK